jgi:hypothetical protein
MLLYTFIKHLYVMFGSKSLHSEELHSLFCSPIEVRGNKSRRLRWAGHIARMEEGRVLSKFYLVDLKERAL